MQDLIEHSLKQNMNKDEAIELISQVEIEPNFTKLGNENFRPVAMTCFSFFLSQFYFTPTSFCQTLVCSIVSNTKKKKIYFCNFFSFHFRCFTFNCQTYHFEMNTTSWNPFKVWIIGLGYSIAIIFYVQILIILKL